jgi:hypothetical protein
VKDLKGKNVPMAEQPMKSLELRSFDSAALRRMTRCGGCYKATGER